LFDVDVQTTAVAPVEAATQTEPPAKCTVTTQAVPSVRDASTETGANGHPVRIKSVAIQTVAILQTGSAAVQTDPVTVLVGLPTVQSEEVKTDSATIETASVQTEGAPERTLWEKIMTGGKYRNFRYFFLRLQKFLLTISSRNTKPLCDTSAKDIT